MASSAGIATVLAIGVAVARLPFGGLDLPLERHSKDARAYVGSLAFDSSYNVPPPGNIGFVAAARAMLPIVKDPLVAYLIVNSLLSGLAVAAFFLLAHELVSRPTAVAAALALAASPIVWYYGAALASYQVWLTLPPLIAWLGVRFVNGAPGGSALLLGVVSGLATILRPDMVAFGLPLSASFLVAKRAGARDWTLWVLPIAACTAVWFFSTAWVVGGTERYLELVISKHRFHAGFGLWGAGWLEGLLRNSAKLGIYLIWSSGPLLALAAGFARGHLVSPGRVPRWMLLALLMWVLPGLYFGTVVFAGTAGLLFPLLPPLYLLIASALETATPRRAALVLTAAAVIAATQFLATPVLSERNQRDVILNIMIFRYTGAGMLRGYNYNLTDYGMDTSLRESWKQIRDPEPVPLRP
jgi:hypothetical protein